MAVGIVEDLAGTRSVVTATSEPNGYLRPGVTCRDEEMTAPGPHGRPAEETIVHHADDHGLDLGDLCATRPTCKDWHYVTSETTRPVTPLK